MHMDHDRPDTAPMGGVDAQGHWTSVVTPDAEGFVNFLAVTPPNTSGPMTAVKAAALINKQVG